MPKTDKHLVIDGLPVRNLKKAIRLTITAEDCRHGNTRAPSGCAAALAAQRLPHVSEARVHIGRIFLKIGKRYWLRGKTPGALRTEIISFDRGGKFEPGVYTIRPLSPSEFPRGARTGGKDRTNRNSRRGVRMRPMKIIKSVRNNAHIEYAYK